MADAKKISELTAISVIDDANDLLEIVDVSESDANANKKITPDQVVSGKQTIWIPAKALEPTQTNPCGVLTAIEAATNDVNIIIRGFSGTGTDVNHGFLDIKMPTSWDLGTLTFSVVWTVNASVATVVVWQLKAVALSDNTTLDTAYGSAATVSDTAQSGIREVYISGESGALTVGNSPAAGDWTQFDFFRDAGNGSDTMTNEAELIGFNIFYTTNVKQDT
jgi:hypothetical protein